MHMYGIEISGGSPKKNYCLLDFGQRLAARITMSMSCYGVRINVRIPAHVHRYPPVHIRINVHAFVHHARV
jgi:hypothetical protein